jgi:hypothetical protein
VRAAHRTIEPDWIDPEAAFLLSEIDRATANISRKRGGVLANSHFDATNRWADLDGSRIYIGTVEDALLNLYGFQARDRHAEARAVAAQLHQRLRGLLHSIEVSVIGPEVVVSYPADVLRSPSASGASALWDSLAARIGVTAAVVEPEDDLRVGVAVVDEVRVTLLAERWEATQIAGGAADAKFDAFLASLPPRHDDLGREVLTVRVGTELPNGALIAAVTDAGSDTAWFVTDDRGGEHRLDKYGRLVRSASGAVLYVEPEWSGLASD